MLEQKVKFVCSRFIEFKGESGQIVRGYQPYVLNEETDEIIRCKLQKEPCNDFTIGDNCSVFLVVRGRYANYIFNNSKE